MGLNESCVDGREGKKLLSLYIIFLTWNGGR